MKHLFARSAFTAAVLLAILPVQVGAVELYYRTDLGLDAWNDADDLVFTTELTNSGSALALGAAPSSIPYHLDNNNFYPADASVIGGGSVSYGSIKGVVGGTSASAGVGIGATAVFTGRYIDSMTMTPTDPALIGTLGTMIGTVMVHVNTPLLNTLGTSTFPGTLESQVSLQWVLLGVENSNASGTGYWVNADEGGGRGDYVIQDLGTGLGGIFSADGVNSVLVPVWTDFVWGSPFEAGLELQATALVAAGSFGGPDPASASGSLDFLNTVNWQGIQSVRDGQGNLVTGWTVSAESGTDYSSAVVPAPGALLLMLTALGGLVTRMRKR